MIIDSKIDGYGDGGGLYGVWNLIDNYESHWDLLDDIYSSQGFGSGYLDGYGEGSGDVFIFISDSRYKSSDSLFSLGAGFKDGSGYG